MRRLSCIPESFNLVSPHRSSIHRDASFVESERRTSQQEIACNAAVQWLQERRKSTDASGILGAIDESLYRKRGSIVNVRGSKDSLCVARCQLQLSYNFSTSDFVIVLLEASFELKLEECQLAFILTSDRSDQRKESRRLLPNVGVQLQTFKFPIAYEELVEQTLTVELISPKAGVQFQRHARSVLPLSDLCPFDELLIWTELEAIADNKESCGDLRVFLQYLPTAERLSINLHEVVNLRRLDSSHRDGGGFVKVQLVSEEGKVLKKRKSTTRKGTAATSIVWNEALTFDVDLRTLSRCKLEVMVFGSDKLGDHPLGQLVFGGNL
ncbi:C2 domain-containing protein [Aphelenchoides fujianensis]|nr:C2 domain-containing protein [Aphelenchoides fujianensis]